MNQLKSFTELIQSVCDSLTLQLHILILEEQHGKSAECISMANRFFILAIFVLSKLDMKTKELTVLIPH